MYLVLSHHGIANCESSNSTRKPFEDVSFCIRNFIEIIL